MLDAIRARLRRSLSRSRPSPSEPSADAAADSPSAATPAAQPSARTSLPSPSEPARPPRSNRASLSAASPRRSLNLGSERLSRNLGSIRHRIGSHLHPPSLRHTQSSCRSAPHSTSHKSSSDAAPAPAAGASPHLAGSGQRAADDAVSHAPSASTLATSSSLRSAAGPHPGTDKIPARFRQLFANNGRLHEPGSGNLALYPGLSDLLPLYGTATNTAWTEPMYTIFEQPLPENRQHGPAEQAAYVGYLLNAPDGKQAYAIAWGNPLCHPDNYAYVAQRWVYKMAAEGKRPLWCCCSEVFMNVLTRAHPQVVGDEAPRGTAKRSSHTELDWSALTCIHEDVVDPREFRVENVEKFVRTKLRKAHRKGLRIIEVHGRFPDPRVDGSSALSRDQVEEGILAWKESKAAKGAQIHASDTEPWRDLAHRKYFYAVAPREDPTLNGGREGAGRKKTPAAGSVLLTPSLAQGGKSSASSATDFSIPEAFLEYHDEEKVVGMCVLAPIAEGKYVVKWLLEFDQDVKGTSECLIVHVIERLRDAGSPNWPTRGPAKDKQVATGADGDGKPLSNREKARRARKARQQTAQTRSQDQSPTSTAALRPANQLEASDATTSKPNTELVTEQRSSDAPEAACRALGKPAARADATPVEGGRATRASDNAGMSRASLAFELDGSYKRIESTASSVDLGSTALFIVPCGETGAPVSQPEVWDETKRPVCTSLSFGISGGELKPVRNLNVGLRFTTITAAYNALSKAFHLGSKGSFRTKFGASHETAAYIAFPKGSLGFKMIDAIVGALKEDQNQDTNVEAILGDTVSGSSPPLRSTSPLGVSPLVQTSEPASDSTLPCSHPSLHKVLGAPVGQVAA